MRILALETSGRSGSVALLRAGQGDAAPVDTMFARQTPGGERTAQSLVPAIQLSLAEAGWRPRDIELICVTTGPGSFTGLRIGVVTAKSFAYAAGAALVGVHTLAAMAAGAPGAIEGKRLWTILDAQRQELFVSSFEGPAVDDFEPKTEILSIADFLARLAPGDAATGPPLVKLRSELPLGVTAVEESLWNPNAVATGWLGIRKFHRGQAISPMELAPNYFRKSAAEEKAGI